MTDAEQGRHGRVFAGASRFARDAPQDHQGGLFRLAADASQWERLERGLPQDAQVRAVAVDPDDSSIVWCGTDEGPHRSGDGGDSWERVELPGPYHTVWSLAFAPGDASVIYAGTAPAGLYRSTDRGAHWEFLKDAAIRERLDMGFPTRLISLCVNPLDHQDVWAGVEVGGMMHSTDGGRTWADATDALEALAEQTRYQSRLFSDTDAEGMLDIHRVTMSTAAPGVAFIALRMGIFRSDGPHGAWNSLGVEQASPLSYCRDVRVSPHDPRVLYAALSDQSIGVKGSVYRSEDLGETWKRFDRIDPEPVSTMMVVAPSPDAASELWCASRRGDVWATFDGGNSWHGFPLPAGGRDVYTLVCG